MNIQRIDYNISFLRNIAIICIILHHTLTIYTGWPPNHIVNTELPAYMLIISQLLKGLGLGAFTFISGYLMFNQSKKKYPFKSFAKNKAQRLLYPLFFFGVAYQILFPSFMLPFWPTPFNGTHLWYLPMLFICMMITSIDLYSSKTKIWLGIIYLSILCTNQFIYFRTFSELSKYLPLFIIGYLFNKYQLNKKIQKCKQLIFWLILLHQDIHLKGITQLYFSCIFTYLLLIKYRKNAPLSKFGTLISNQSFTIYILHQFVINSLLLSINFNEKKWILSFIIVSTLSFLLPLFIGDIYTKIRYKLLEKYKK